MAGEAKRVNSALNPRRAIPLCWTANRDISAMLMISAVVADEAGPKSMLLGAKIRHEGDGIEERHKEGQVADGPEAERGASRDKGAFRGNRPIRTGRHGDRHHESP